MGGCCSSSGGGGDGNHGGDEGEGDFIAKQDVTLWSYNGDVLSPSYIHGQSSVEVKATTLAMIKSTWYFFQVLTPDDLKWWKVKCGHKEGFAAKYYFAPKAADKEYEKEPWYFGDMTREEAEDLLADPANPDGAFLVRHTNNKRGAEVLTLKYHEGYEFKYKNYNVKTEGQGFFFTRRKLCDTVPELIQHCMDNKADGVVTKLTNICLISNPQSDPNFEHFNKEHDALRVPFHELQLGDELGSGQFGKVYKARFRGNVDVAVKQLKVDNEEEGAKALDEFFREISNMRGLNHPNLIQLFAFVISEKEGNFMIQEFAANGDMKLYLQKLKKDPKKMRSQENPWSQLLGWTIQVARGMEQLEYCKLVHRDLAAR